VGRGGRRDEVRAYEIGGRRGAGWERVEVRVVTGEGVRRGGREMRGGQGGGSVGGEEGDGGGGAEEGGEKDGS